MGEKSERGRGGARTENGLGLSGRWPFLRKLEVAFEEGEKARELPGGRQILLEGNPQKRRPRCPQREARPAKTGGEYNILKE